MIGGGEVEDAVHAHKAFGVLQEIADLGRIGADCLKRGHGQVERLVDQLRGFADLKPDERETMGRKNGEYVRFRFARARLTTQMIGEIERLFMQQSGSPALPHETGPVSQTDVA